MRRIVIGVDGSEPSLRGVRWVAEWAPSSAEVWLTFAMGPKPQLTQALREAYETTAHELSADHLVPARSALSERGLTGVHEEVRYGYPADVLLEVAAENEASAIVVGSSGRGRLACLILGSVAQSVVAQDRFTVIVVH
jgi:nucleotide-binding universal stress UspA family protein